jgi:hypothetical protein
MATVRSAQEIIDQAIGENRFGERLCYAFATLFVLVGIGVIIWGAKAGDGIVSIAGSIAGILFWPAVREARQMRKENMMIRPLEAPLSMATTADAAAKSLRDAFVSTFVKK